MQASTSKQKQPVWQKTLSTERSEAMAGEYLHKMNADALNNLRVTFNQMGSPLSARAFTFGSETS